RRERARTIGADADFQPSAVDGRVLHDVVFDCAAKGGSVRQAIEMARAGGRVVFTGIPSELETPVEFHTWRRKELALFQVRRSNHESALAREILSADPGRFAPLITHTLPLDRIDRAFAQRESPAAGAGQLIIRLDACQE